MLRHEFLVDISSATFDIRELAFISPIQVNTKNKLESKFFFDMFLKGNGISQRFGFDSEDEIIQTHQQLIARWADEPGRSLNVSRGTESL